jgi:hypothetical protein
MANLITRQCKTWFEPNLLQTWFDFSTRRLIHLFYNLDFKPGQFLIYNYSSNNTKHQIIGINK